MFWPLYSDSIVLPNGAGVPLDDLPLERPMLESLALQPSTGPGLESLALKPATGVEPPPMPPVPMSVGYYTWDPLNPPAVLRQIPEENVQTEVEVIPDEEEQEFPDEDERSEMKLEDMIPKDQMKLHSGLLAMRFACPTVNH